MCMQPVCIMSLCDTQKDRQKALLIKVTKSRRRKQKRESGSRTRRLKMLRESRGGETDRQFISKKEAVFPDPFLFPIRFSLFPSFTASGSCVLFSLPETSFLFPFFLSFFFATPSLDTSFASAVFRFPLNPSSAARVTILSISLFLSPAFFCLFLQFLRFLEILNLSYS